ncbi:MAG: ATP-dependent Clp protease ATP-binding subunit [Rhabdochlamydiaceae bacterium]|nr:ATP-dependent Clp protease ATP-binding subunit [Rhabdochlamydiaceae bacterium]
MNQIALIGKQFNWVYESCKKPLLENKRGIVITLAAVGAIAAVAFVYKRLYPVKLTDAEKRDLADSCQKYSPQVFANRLQASLSVNDVIENPKTPEEWFKWIGNASYVELRAMMDKVTASYREGSRLLLEDEKAYAIQTWVLSIQPLLTLIKESPTRLHELLVPIQSSPRLAYTILFNCMAPFAAKAIWQGIYEYLPVTVREAGSTFMEHNKGKIALFSFGALVWLYRRMRLEKGIISNLTENCATFHAPHKGLDRVESYKKGIDQLFQVMQSSQAGELGSNVLWYYPAHTHATFKGEIGRTLAEMAAAGRSPIQDLQVIELDLRVFLTEYRDENEVYRGWNEALKFLSKNKNVLVLLTGIDSLKNFFFSKGDDKETRHMKCEKILAALIDRALKRGAFRCLIEMKEDDKQQMERSPDLYRFFSAIRAPDIQPDELNQLCQQLYSVSDSASSYEAREINNLFKQHLIPIITKTPISPLRIMDIIQEGVRDRWACYRLQADESVQNKIKALGEAEEIKEGLLQRVWHYTRRRQDVPVRLIQELLLAEKVVLPLLKIKGQHSENDLVSRVQKKFFRLFGPCTAEEEERLKNLPDLLGTVIKGQEDAITLICNAIYRWRKVPTLNGKPLVLFFAGGPGVGKSETATQLAYHLNSIYGIIDTASQTHASNVKRINLNRNGQGLLGWDKIKGEILAHLLHEPTSVVILEEWDKMGDNEKNNLLELLDDSQNHLQDPWGFDGTNGPFVDRSSAIFILTSNIEIGNESLHYLPKIQKGIEASFAKGQHAAPFLSRVDALIPFRSVEQEGARAVVERALNEYVQMGLISEGQVEDLQESLVLQARDIDIRELQRVMQEAILKKINQAE